MKLTQWESQNYTERDSKVDFLLRRLCSKKSTFESRLSALNRRFIGSFH